MADEHRCRQRHGRSFWRAHHEAWKRSDLNQRQYPEAQGIRSKPLATGGRSSKPNRRLPCTSCSIDVAA